MTLSSVDTRLTLTEYCLNALVYFTYREIRTLNLIKITNTAAANEISMDASAATVLSKLDVILH